MLWLLHGGFGSAADWTAAGDAEALTAGLPMVVVMPDAGIGGWYTDWKRGTSEGPQRWETFHLDELRPFVEARYQTRTDRGGRAVAGLSMGGFGAMSYAARHPDLFGFAASFSGAVDLLHPGVTAIVSISPLAHQGVPGDIFGLPRRRRGDLAGAQPRRPRREPAHHRDPAAHRQRRARRPARRDFDPQEGGVSQATATLHGRLNTLGIPHVYVDYGPGAHTWPYWRDDLQATLPGITAFFGRVKARQPETAAAEKRAGAQVSHRATSPAGSGHVAEHRDPVQDPLPVEVVHRRSAG